MKVLFLSLLLLNQTSADNSYTKKTINCEDYSWSDITSLVEPYLDDVLYTALVMQGESSNYNVSEAARQAYDESLPDDVKHELLTIINADC
ncbi:MAG: hypothetical protein OEY19_06280 [Gammaproteobacteria bacterium]|nr:hypothetical protein [Gammaproteobacteria bacterium]MDH5629075.1 hypothetical protein [Gammaproteobacteria bacterium]